MLLVDEAGRQERPRGQRRRPAPKQSDDDFLLTPLEEAGAEESDSGSQVIALEGDVEFEEAGPGASGVDSAEAPADSGGGLLEEDLGEGLGAGLGGAA